MLVKKHLNYIFFILLVFPTGQNAFGQRVADTVLNRHKAFLVNTQVKVDKDSILRNYDAATKQFINIRYNDMQPSGWRLSEHLNNVTYLSLSYADKTSPKFRDPKLKSVIAGALGHWLDNRYKSNNWWHNEIGVPLIMRDIIVLLRDELSPAEMKEYLSIMAQHKVKGTGANLTWSADIGMYYALLTGDLGKVDEYSKLIKNEVRISDGEGLKPDYSFHQHQERLQMYQYGAAFLLNNIRIAWELRNTPWQFETHRTDLLAKMLLNGWQWMARGIYTIPGTMDRSISRVDAVKAADLRPYIPLIKDLAPAQSAEFDNVFRSQNTDWKYLKGFRYYPYSDFAVYHRPEFSFFLKTISNRTLVTEAINSENLKGKLLNSGDHYFVRSGNEYLNMMPVLDWNHLPGVSTFKNASFIIKSDFAGSVGDGQFGLTAMDYAIRDSQNTRSFAAKKIWVNYKDVLLCLLGDIRLNNIDTAYTTLDQSRQQWEVLAEGKKIGKYQKESETAKFVYHNKMSYSPLFGQALHLKTGEATGSWYSINHSYADTIIREKVFMPYILHTTSDPPRQSGYMISYAKNKCSAKRVSRKTGLEILVNDGSKQITRFEKEVFFCAFYAKGTFNGQNISISTDRPCLLMVNVGKLSISDPLRQGGKTDISINQTRYSLNLPADGSSITINL